MQKEADKVIITVLGKDTVGIIARVCTYLSENGINVLDISQTIIQGYFNMMMIVDMNASAVSFSACSGELDRIGRKSASVLNARRKKFLNRCTVFNGDNI